MAETVQGTLEVYLINAVLTNDVASFSKMDPYVLLTYGEIIELKSVI